MKKILCFLVGSLILLLTFPVGATTLTDLLTETKIWGEIRLDAYNLDNLTDFANTDKDTGANDDLDSRVDPRIRVWLKTPLAERMEAVVMLESWSQNTGMARLWGQGSATLGLKEWEVEIANAYLVLPAFVDLTLIGAGKTDLIIGKQLVGEDNNLYLYVKGLDALRVKTQAGPVDIELTGGKFAETGMPANEDIDFYSLLFSSPKLIQHQFLYLGAINTVTQDPVEDQVNSPKLLVLGAQGGILPNLTYLAEYASLFGKAPGDIEHKASAYRVKVAYQGEVPLAFLYRTEVEFASGTGDDDPWDDENNNFSTWNLSPDFNYYGVVYGDLVGGALALTNKRILALRTNISPTPGGWAKNLSVPLTTTSIS